MDGPLRVSEELLPLYIVPFELKENLYPGGKARATPDPIPRPYPAREYRATLDWLEKMRGGPNLADRILKDWEKHLVDYECAAQFKDDPNGQRYVSLHEHTQLVSLFADTASRIDTSVLWSALRNAKEFEFIHSDFRAEPDKAAVRERYEQRLEEHMRRSATVARGTHPVVSRLCRVVSSKALETTCKSDSPPDLSMARTKRFAVGLSFPGEKRGFVEQVAQRLAKRLSKERILYDKYHEVELARPNLDVYLPRLYHDSTELNVVFLCSEYNEKEWCGLEWRAIRDLMKRREDERIMLMRFDDADIEGLYSIDGYIDLSRVSPEQCADLILQRSMALAGEPTETSSVGVTSGADLAVSVNNAWIALEAEMERTLSTIGRGGAKNYRAKATRFKKAKFLSDEAESTLDRLRARYRPWRRGGHEGIRADEAREFIREVNQLKEAGRILQTPPF